jgi:hypothetical protein
LKFVDAALTFNPMAQVTTMAESDTKTDVAETVRADRVDGSPEAVSTGTSSSVAVGGQQLEGVPETSEDQGEAQRLDGGGGSSTVNSVKDKRKERLDRLRELHLRRVGLLTGLLTIEIIARCTCTLTPCHTHTEVIEANAGCNVTCRSSLLAL